MAATVEVLSYHGASPTPGSVTSVRFKGDQNGTGGDNDTANTLNPLLVPGAGTTYSLRKHTKLNVTVAPANEISNLRFLKTGGTFVSGYRHWANSDASYVQGSAGDGAALVIPGMDDTALGGSFGGDGILDVNTGVVIGASTGTGTQDFVVQQMSVDTGSVTGLSGKTVLAYRWDES